MTTHRTLRSQRQLLALLRHWDELLADAPTANRRSDRLSRWSVAQHVQHLLAADALVLPRLTAALGQPAPGPASRLSLVGRLVLWSGYIPRGRGRAPEPTRPSDQPEPAALRTQLAAEVAAVEGLGEHHGRLPGLATGIDHPYFGRLDGAQWMRFLEVHHRHHAKIVTAILAATA
jgi:hypothetical protein